MARIAVGGFHHATNSFSPTSAPYEEFERGYSWPPLTRGEGLFAAVADASLALSGFVAEAKARGHDLIPTVWAAASPSGPVTQDAYERIALMLLDDVTEAGRVDAIYLDLQGAMVADHVADGDGELLRRLRDIVDRDVPIVASVGYHANLTPEMVRHASMLIAGRTYPQADAVALGRQAVGRIDMLLSGRQVGARLRRLPFEIPLPWSCTSTDPAASAFRLLEALERDGIDSLSLTAGFPLADVPDRLPAILGYGTDSGLVDRAVARLAEHLQRECRWTGETLDPDAAVVEAMRRAQAASRPILLADVQDDPSAGGTGDTSGLLSALVRHGASATLGLVYDPHVATIAHRCGEGAEIAVCLGGKHGTPDGSFDASFVVERLADGRFTCSGPVYAGTRMELAPVTCLRIGDVRVAVVGKRVQAADQAMFRHLGIDPAAERILALKSTADFRADFEPIADSVLLVTSPGPACVDIGQLAFTTERAMPG